MSSTIADVVLPILVIISTLFTTVLLLLPARYEGKDRTATSEQSRPSNEDVSVQVLVLGDIGRSPRMQYHALSIASHGGSVQLIGYLDSEPLPALSALKNVSMIPLPASPKMLQTSNRILFLLFAPIKVFLQVWNLWVALGYRTTAARWMLVQNPPSIPSLFIATVVCFLRNTKLIIDWHNFGYSILALKLGAHHPLVYISRLYENFFAGLAPYHLAVTNVMASILRKGLPENRPVFSLHDRPATIFQPFATDARVAFISQHPLTIEHFEAFAEHKLKVLVSSTSWTPDEDFNVLLEALCKYSEQAATSSSQLPELLVIITGKGPQQEHYIKKIKALEAAKKLELVTIKTEWLSFQDYASLLASADLGVSLHTSSSGVDLPMKVVDMFGAGLPVLGFDNFKAWSELVKEGVNGKGFSSSEQMAMILGELFEPSSTVLDTLREGALLESKRRWSAEWDPIVGRLLGLA